MREHLVVEGAHVEPLAHATGDLVPCTLDLALAELVRQLLAGPDGVAVHLDLRVDHGQRAPLVHEPDRPRAVPALRMQPGVHDQPRRAERLRVEHPDALVLRGIELHLIGQALGIQPPAFRVRRSRQA